MRVSLIVPVLNEERLIYPLLTSLQQIKGQSSELVIVDGGSPCQRACPTQKGNGNYSQKSQGYHGFNKCKSLLTIHLADLTPHTITISS